MRKRIILLTCSKSDYQVQIVLARKLREFGFIRPICCFNTVTNSLRAEVTQCAEEGFDTMEIFGVDDSDCQDRDLDDGNESEYTSLCGLFWKTFNNRRMVIKLFRRLLKKLEIELVITSSNDLRYLMPYIIKACSLEKIKTVFIPSTIKSIGAYMNVLDSTFPRACINEASNMLSFCLKRWTYLSAEGKRAVCLPLEELLTLKLLSAAPEHPTSPWGGNADYFFAPSTYVYKFYRDLIPKKTQSIVTGTPFSDLLFEALNSPRYIYTNMCTKYDVSDSRKMILVLLPQLPLSILGKAPESSLSQEFLHILLSRLSSIGGEYNIFVSSEAMPPDTQLSSKVELFKNIRLVNENLANLIPLCQFYVCCDPSTIGMAIVCNNEMVGKIRTQNKFKFVSEWTRKTSKNPIGSTIPSLKKQPFDRSQMAKACRQ